MDGKSFALWPYFSPDEIEAAVKVLKSGKVNQWGRTEVSAFEKEFAKFIGVKYAVALVNGSVALDTALKILGIGKGDDVIVPCRSFVASASCVPLSGARAVFADVDENSQNLTVESIKKVITPKTRAVIAVHLAGWPCELDTLKKFCKEKNIYLIEDCAQAHGAKYKGKKAGSFGDVACFSFCQDKIMTTGGEGGMILTDNKKLWEKAWAFKDHGRSFKEVFRQNVPFGFRYLCTTFGTNYRMTEIQAAIGRVMLKKLDGWISKRRKLAGILNKGFTQIPGLKVTIPPKEIFHSYYKYYVFVKPGELKKGWSRDLILQILNKAGISASIGSCPEIYLEKSFKKINPGQKRLAIGKELGETSMMFMVHPTLTSENMHYIISEMKKVMNEAVGR